MTALFASLGARKNWKLSSFYVIFIYINENCKLVDEPKELKSNRTKHYVKKHATYVDVKKYILDNYVVKVHTSYIAEIKRKHGVEIND